MMWDSSTTNFSSNLAVVIGINNYQNGIHSLKTAVNDAAALADLLETNYNYQVLRLFPQHKNQNEATLENINKLLSETLPQKIQSPEVCRLLFYFAGHGIARNGEHGPAGYLVPQNAQLGKIETFIPMQTLYKALTDLSCHHLLVILDCCFAGTFRWSSTRNVISVPDKIHKDWVHSVAISPDGQMIVSGSADRTVRLWDLQGNPISEPFRGHEKTVHSVAFSPDGQMIVSGSIDGTVRLWDLQGNTIGQPFREHEHPVLSVAFSPDEPMIVSGGYDGTVRLSDLQGNPIGQPFRGHKGYIWSVAFSRDGQRIVSSGDDGTVRLWDLQGTPIGQPFTGHKDTVFSVAFSPDGQMIVSGGIDNTVRLWDIQGNPIGQPFTGHENTVFSVAFSLDGQRIASGSRDNTVRLWDLQGNPISEPLRHENYVWSVAFSPDGQRVVSGSHDYTVRLWHGGWEAWLQVCCNRLRYHPIFQKPEEIQNSEQRTVAIAACETCKKYVWNKADSSTR